MRLKDQVAVVTGAGGGLGEGICLCLAREGAHIVASDQNLGSAEKVADKINQRGQKAIALQTDVRNADQCRTLIDETKKRLGGLDILVCNAGVMGVRLDDTSKPHLIENIRDEDWDLVMDVNLKGVFHCCQAAVPYFKEKKGGRIVNISSIAGRQGTDGLLAYSASKAGVISLTQSLALQLAHFHINVNTVCPGLIWSSMQEQVISLLSKTQKRFATASPEEIFQAFVKQQVPFGNPQTIEDIGNAVVFFASDDAKEITGQALNVCGGMKMN